MSDAEITWPAMHHVAERLSDGRTNSVSSVSEPATLPRRLTQATQRQLIRAALAQDPTLPDRRIARAIGCADTTVARVRKADGVPPYRRHRDRRPSGDAPASRRQLREEIAMLTSELAQERRRRIEAEQALAAVHAALPAALPAAQESRPPAPAKPAPVCDPAMGRPAQVPTYGRGLPAAVHCQGCGDTRYWTDRDVQVWYCAGCYPPGHGQLIHKAGRWPP
jgi:hypothetical protein